MFDTILETQKIEAYLKKRGLLPQYQKAKQFIISGNHTLVDFKQREPKVFGVYYFRINKQFRAFARKEGSKLIVFKIDNHQ